MGAPVRGAAASPGGAGAKVDAARAVREAWRRGSGIAASAAAGVARRVALAVAVRAAAAATVALGTGSAGCGGDTPVCPAARLQPPARAAAYAVVTSDYAVTAVALLDADGALVDEAFVDSGTAAAGLVATLSGDVTLPSTPWGAGRLLLLDRYPADVLTHLHLDGSAPPVQAVTRAEDASRGWSANPHDALRLPDGRWLVTRFEPNLLPDAPPLDRGDDLAIVDPARGRVVERLDLSPLGAREGGVPVPARPDRVARLQGGRIVVGLARLSFDFRVTGPGAVAVVDLATGEARALALEGLRFCGDVRALPGDAGSADPDGATGRVVVLCQGRTWATEAERAAEAGLGVIGVDAAGEAVVERVWRAGDDARASPTALVAALDGARVVVAAYGEDVPARAPTTDRLLVVDLGSGAATVVHEAPDRFSLGPGAFDAARGLLLVPDGARGVLRLDVARDGAVTPRDHVDVSPCRRLAARQVAPLR